MSRVFIGMVFVFLLILAPKQPVYANGSQKAHSQRSAKRPVDEGMYSGYVPRGWLYMTGEEMRDSVVVAGVADQELSTCRQVLSVLSKNRIPSFCMGHRGIGISVPRKDREKAKALIKQDALRAGYRVWLAPEGNEKGNKGEVINAETQTPQTYLPFRFPPDAGPDRLVAEPGNPARTR